MIIRVFKTKTGYWYQMVSPIQTAKISKGMMQHYVDMVRAIDSLTKVLTK